MPMEYTYAELSTDSQRKARDTLHEQYYDFVNRRIKDHIIKEIERFGILHDQVRFHCSGCKCLVGITGQLARSAVRRVVVNHLGDTCGGGRIMHTIDTMQPEVRFSIGANNVVYANTAAVMPDHITAVTIACNIMNLEMVAFVDQLRDSTDVERANYDSDAMFIKFMADNDYLFDKEGNLLN